MILYGSKEKYMLIERYVPVVVCLAHFGTFWAKIPNTLFPTSNTYFENL